MFYLLGGQILWPLDYRFALKQFCESFHSIRHCIDYGMENKMLHHKKITTKGLVHQ
jgi:hypothetical protein